MLRLLYILSLFLLAFSVFSASGGKQKTVTPSTYKLLQRAEKQIAAAAYSEAISKLKAGLADLDAGSFDKAVVLRSMASAYSLKGEYKKAARALEDSVATKALPVDQQAEARKNLGELYVASGQYSKAVGHLESSISKAKSVTGEQYFMLANAYAQLKKYKKAAPYMQKAISRTAKPSEQWYRMLLALYYESGNYKGGVNTLRKMIQTFPPKKDYWLQLIAMYRHMNQDSAALAVNELAYKEGFITSPQELTDLANMMSRANLPYRSARLLEKEMQAGRLKRSSKNWEKVANAWNQAKEFDRAAAALKKASALHSTGELSFRLGQIYIEQENWKKAHAALLKAINKGGLSDPGTAQILFGLSCHELHFPDKARQAFSRAQKYSNSRKTGREWVNYLDSEG